MLGKGKVEEKEDRKNQVTDRSRLPRIGSGQIWQRGPSGEGHAWERKHRGAGTNPTSHGRPGKPRRGAGTAGTGTRPRRRPRWQQQPRPERGLPITEPAALTHIWLTSFWRKLVLRQSVSGPVTSMAATGSASRRLRRCPGPPPRNRRAAASGARGIAGNGVPERDPPTLAGSACSV